MGIEGNYKQIGNETLKELHKSLKGDNKIDKKEFENIKLSVVADKNKTKGEIELLNRIEDCLNKNLDINSSEFAPKGNSINFDLKISKNSIQISDSKEENFKSKIPTKVICDFLNKKFDKLKNKDGRIDLQSLENALRSSKFSSGEKLVLDRVIQNLDLFLNKEVKNFSDITLPPYGISKDGIQKLINLSNNQNSKEIQNKLLHLENTTFRSNEHIKIIDRASKVSISENSKEWANLDVLEYVLKSKTKGMLDPSKGQDFIGEFKDNYIRSHKEIIKEASKLYGIPENLLAGVLHKEVGGDPYIIDDISYIGRKNLPTQIKSIIKDIPEIDSLSADKQLTSFGNVSIQIRRAKESLGYSYNISTKQEEEIIKSLKNPKEAIFICAKHLKDLKQIDFKNKPFNKLSNYELSIIATRYNAGPGDTRERLAQKGFGYGQNILDNFKNISELLK